MFFVLNLETLYISYLHLVVGTSEEIFRGDRWVIEAFSQLEQPAMLRSHSVS
ncbi:MAG: hypothetical protein V7K86_16505 [Nostoc sp.]